MSFRDGSSVSEYFKDSTHIQEIAGLLRHDGGY